MTGKRDAAVKLTFDLLDIDVILYKFLHMTLELKLNTRFAAEELNLKLTSETCRFDSQKGS